MKYTPSDTSNGVVSVICNPIIKSFWSTSFTLNLAEKYALLLVLSLNGSPFNCKKSESLAASSFEINN